MDLKILKIIAIVTILILYLGQRLPTALRNWKGKKKVKRLSSSPLVQSSTLSENELKKRNREKRKVHFESIYGNADFVNRNTTKLEDFVINDRINRYDLQKLTELNETDTQFFDGWNNLVLELMRELDASGWDRKVLVMKEKWGELRFSVGINADEKLHEITEKYLEKSLEICHLCGEAGKLRNDNPYWEVLCEEHYKSGGAPLYSEYKF
ncbi:hypothetical protein F7018_05420 [Tenacibaculum aiptasiae]|uniref:Uncharacterized protein n=1 Tax=Tenacibaculum aiptasiae TaxID=426481 RepID=A0A7J5AQ50_9FLAO|nr:hypothetical protein [Tenacibaculum aiptasiae]KAB1159749.1 hypothetical protein F7018_05420 [Tenacibaculum aiptasiae]